MFTLLESDSSNSGVFELDHVGGSAMKKPVPPPRRRIALMVSLLALVAGCQSTNIGVPGSVALSGTSWLAEEIDGRGVLEKVRSTLEFEGERVDGSAGCNRFSAPVVTNGNALHAGIAETTRVVCSPVVMGQELRFFAALAATTSYRIEDDSLRLMDLQGVTSMRLARMLVSPRTYVCGDGASFISLHIRPAGADTVEAVFSDTSRLLARVPAVSGERFENGDISISSMGSEATLEISGHRYACDETAGG
jgi:heat shock protein HslJ